MNNDMQDQIAERAAAMAHPLPHPQRYDHGEIKFSTFGDWSAHLHQKVDTAGPTTHPGPITMFDKPPRRLNGWVAALGIGTLLFWGGVATYIIRESCK